MFDINNQNLSISKQNPNHIQSVGHDLEIPLFDKLFSRHPDAKMLAPETYVRQPVARRVIKNGNRWHHVGLFSSRLNQALVPFESGLEKHACMFFESWSQINSYVSQPYAVRLFYAGKIHTIYPDFELITGGQRVLVDVKFEKEARKHNFQERVKALNFYSEQRGMSYSVLNEKEIRGHRLQNAHWLTSLARGKASPDLVEVVLGWLFTQDTQTLGDAIRSTAGYPQVQSVIASLALDGHLAFSWDIPIQDQLVSLVIVSEE